MASAAAPAAPVDLFPNTEWTNETDTPGYHEKIVRTLDELGAVLVALTKAEFSRSRTQEKLWPRIVILTIGSSQGESSKKLANLLQKTEHTDILIIAMDESAGSWNTFTKPFWITHDISTLQLASKNKVRLVLANVRMPQTTASNLEKAKMMYELQKPGQTFAYFTPETCAKPYADEDGVRLKLPDGSEKTRSFYDVLKNFLFIYCADPETELWIENQAWWHTRGHFLMEKRNYPALETALLPFADYYQNINFENFCQLPQILPRKHERQIFRIISQYDDESNSEVGKKLPFFFSPDAILRRRSGYNAAHVAALNAVIAKEKAANGKVGGKIHQSRRRRSLRHSSTHRRRRSNRR